MGADGFHAETLACRYLMRRGWRILARNWSGGGGELDLVALRAGLVAFVEVKSRADAEALDEPVTLAQQVRWINAARAFLARRADLDRAAARLDVIAVDTSRSRRHRIVHIPDAISLAGDVGNPRPGVGSDTRRR
jgi:putative endonuclease